MKFSIARFAEVGSTMDKARSLAENTCEPGFLVLADRQTAGRGRIENRAWVGRPGASLFMTLCLKGDFAFKPTIPLRIGLAVREALFGLLPAAASGARVQARSGQDSPMPFLIKWPNDIMGFAPGEEGRPRYKKLGGLLCETSKDWLFAGIGLNVRNGAYPDSLAASATSVEEVMARTEGENPIPLPDPEPLALAIAEASAIWLDRKEWREDYARYLWGLGEEVDFSLGHPENAQQHRGSIEGVDEAGRLLLRDEGGAIEAFCSGEISGLRKR